MTVAEIIDEYNKVRPNQIADDIKIDWLAKLEKQIQSEVIDTHFSGNVPERPNTDVPDYLIDDARSRSDWYVIGDTLYIDGEEDAASSEFGMDTVLHVPDMYSDLYIHYIDQQAALMNNEAQKYNRVTVLFNNAYVTYQQYYNRTHLPKSRPVEIMDHRRL